MAKLIYTAITSLDGYVADADGKFDWSMPDEEVHAFVNDLERASGTYLYGRRLYEVMQAWETMYEDSQLSPVARDYAELWHQAEKIVYSTTLASATTARTRIERSFDPPAIRALKDELTAPISVGGAQLAGQALAAGLVDEIHLLLSPMIVGGGKRALPDGVRLALDLRDERRFGNGVIHLHYAVGN
ncbi:MAG: dihydrofolate reductase family protein [Specibacter sp.]